MDVNDRWGDRIHRPDRWSAQDEDLDIWGRPKAETDAILQALMPPGAADRLMTEKEKQEWDAEWAAIEKRMEEVKSTPPPEKPNTDALLAEWLEGAFFPESEKPKGFGWRPCVEYYWSMHKRLKDARYDIELGEGYGERALIWPDRDPRWVQDRLVQYAGFNIRAVAERLAVKGSDSQIEWLDVLRQDRNFALHEHDFQAHYLAEDPDGVERFRRAVLLREKRDGTKIFMRSVLASDQPEWQQALKEMIDFLQAGLREGVKNTETCDWCRNFNLDPDGPADERTPADCGMLGKCRKQWNFKLPGARPFYHTRPKGKPCKIEVGEPDPEKWELDDDGHYKPKP